MGETTKIQWCDGTFSPWRGCSKVHTGCKHCYAEALGHRFGEGWGEVWQGAPRVLAGPDHMRMPYRLARRAAREGKRIRVFLGSRLDILEEIREPEAWPRDWSADRIAKAKVFVKATREAVERRRAETFQTIRETNLLCSSCFNTGWVQGPERRRRERVKCSCGGVPRPQDSGGLDHLLLSKRLENWRMVPEDIRPLMWLGTSISDQQTADEWVPRLLAAEGFRLRFLSVEPQVGPIDLTRIEAERGDRSVNALTGSQVWHADDAQRTSGPHIDWVIQGGESGPKARPFDLAWARSLRDQCKAAGVPWLFKQAGRRPIQDGVALKLLDGHGGNLSELPDDLRIREFPEVARG